MYKLSEKAKGYGAILIAALLFGTAGTAQHFAPVEAQPEMIGAIRLAIGALLLIVVAIVKHSLIFQNDSVWRSVAIASMGMAVFNMCFFKAIDELGVAIGTTIILGSNPIFTGVLGYLIHGEKLKKSWFVATALAITGCSLLMLQKSEIKVGNLGVLLALGASFSYSLYSVIIRGMVQHDTPVVVIAVTSCVSCLLLVPFVASADLSWLVQLNGIAVVVYLGVFVTAIAYFFLATGLKIVPVGHASTLGLAEPLFAVMLGVILLGESLSTIAIIGIFLVVSGIAYLSINTILNPNVIESPPFVENK